MALTFESAAKKYLELRAECERIEGDAKKQVAALKQIMGDIEAWITIRADEQGLDKVPTPYGTAYWSTHSSCSAAQPDVFRQYVIDNAAWDLLETRANKTGVRAHIEAYGKPPPGVNFSNIRVFNLRANKDN